MSVHLDYEFSKDITKSEKTIQTHNNPRQSRAIQTRGPRGPWVAHLRKRSKVTVVPIIENPRGII